MTLKLVPSEGVSNCEETRLMQGEQSVMRKSSRCAVA